MKLTVTPSGHLAAASARRRAVADEHARAMTEAAAREAAAEMKLAAPRATGGYAETISVRSGPGWSAAGSTHPAALSIEHGRRPGRMPDPTEIADAYGLDQRAAFAVARAIGRDGMAGAHVVERAAEHNTSLLRRLAAGTLARILAVR